MISTLLALYLGFLGLLAIERLVELRISRRNATRAFARGGREYGQRHYRFMAVFHSLFIVSCAAEPLLLHRAFPGVLGFLALAGALAAQALRYWAISTLGDRWNVRIIVIPDLEPVTGGPYRFIRHPNYVAVCAELLLVPLIHGGYLTALVFTVVNAALLYVRIRAEEKALGPEYARSFERLPRFVPGGPHDG